MLFDICFPKNTKKKFKHEYLAIQNEQLHTQLELEKKKKNITHLITVQKSTHKTLDTTTHE